MLSQDLRRRLNRKSPDFEVTRAGFPAVTSVPAWLPGAYTESLCLTFLICRKVVLKNKHSSACNAPGAKEVRQGHSLFSREMVVGPRSPQDLTEHCVVGRAEADTGPQLGTLAILSDGGDTETDCRGQTRERLRELEAGLQYHNQLHTSEHVGSRPFTSAMETPEQRERVPFQVTQTANSRVEHGVACPWPFLSSRLDWLHHSPP